MKTDLSDEEKRLIADALSNNIEPPSELMTKLFPDLGEKFDVAKLDRAKIVTLEYAGKRSEAAILNQAFPTDAGSPLQVERCFKGGSLTGETQLDLFKKAKNGRDDNWQNLIVQGDNLQFLKTCHRNADPLIKDRVKGKVKLFYIDPPFATRGDFTTKEGEDSYADRVDRAEFIEQIRERLLFMRGLLAKEGSIFVHLDQRMSHFIRTVLTEIFGEENFRNEIILPGRASKNLQQQFDEIARLNVRHDNLLWYTASPSTKIPPPWIEKHNKGNPEGHWHHFWSTADRPTMRYKLFGITPQTGQWVWKEERARLGIKHYQRFLEEGGGRTLSEYWRDTGCSLHFIRKSPDDGKPQYWRAPAESRLADTMWAGIPVYSNTTKYPTEKSEKLLGQIIDFVTSPGDLVIDVFAGSGTTAAVAEKLGRRWIVCDFGKHAIYTMQKRMLRIGESKTLGKDVKKNKKYGKRPKPFCVVSTGAYDFSRIMKLRENKDAYIDFVLGLFQISRDEKDLSGKYRFTNIFGEKDGDPVEVYPVWNDEYLKNIRIDENYLKGIILQSGGKLKGNYYIITPETCTLIGDRALKNSAGDEVHFKLLKFPYKILEDVSRNFQIQEQPSSQGNVNNLINSTGFYFNDNVEIEVEKTKEGLKITRFETRILDKQGKRLKGQGGLAMLLVDIDYDGKIFDMDRTVFAKDIGENGEIKLAGLTESVAVIAVDKHGNESKPIIL